MDPKTIRLKELQKEFAADLKAIDAVCETIKELSQGEQRARDSAQGAVNALAQATSDAEDAAQRAQQQLRDSALGADPAGEKAQNMRLQVTEQQRKAAERVAEIQKLTRDSELLFEEDKDASAAPFSQDIVRMHIYRALGISFDDGGARTQCVVAKDGSAVRSELDPAASDASQAADMWRMLGQSPLKENAPPPNRL